MEGGKHQQEDTDEGDEVGLSTLVSQHTSPLTSPKRVETAESFATTATTTTYKDEPSNRSEPSFFYKHSRPIHQEVEPTFQLETAIPLLEDVTRTLLRDRCSHWTPTRISFCGRSIVSAFLLYKTYHNEHNLNLKDENSRSLITDYVLIMDETLASFCGSHAARAEHLVKDGYQFCQILAHRSIDRSHPLHDLVQFCRRSSRLNDEEMMRFVRQSIHNRSKDSVLGLALWPLRNASSIF
jgi:hypothetical protein